MSGASQSGENRGDRDQHGRLLPGHSVGAETRFGTSGNPPPKSPGRPKKDAWVHELEDRLEGRPELRQAIADRLVKVALKGGEQAALKAIAMIQDRVGGPLTHKVEADVTDWRERPRRILLVQTTAEPPAMPAEVRELEEARGAAENSIQEARREG
jgi:hypothetical protein